jgi:hypothetical protein
MSGAQFWVQRDESTCRKRCLEIQEVLSETGPATKKFQDIFGLMDKYTDEDSDVSLLDGLAIPSAGPVFVPASNVVVPSASSPLTSANASGECSGTASSTSSSSLMTESVQGTASSCGGGDRKLLSSDMLQKIAENKVAALARRSATRNEPHRSESHDEIFHTMQWLP